MDYFYEQNTSYRLLFAHRELGNVTYLGGGDFPHRSGIFYPLKSNDRNDSILNHVWNYYDFWLEADRIEQTQGEQAYELFIQEHESNFYDLIESDDWMLRKNDLVEYPIACPIFYVDGHIGWR